MSSTIVSGLFAIIGTTLGWVLSADFRAVGPAQSACRTVLQMCHVTCGDALRVFLQTFGCSAGYQGGRTIRYELT
jgi:hypothetical protein